MPIKDIKKRREYFKNYQKIHRIDCAKNVMKCYNKKKGELFGLLGNKCANPFNLNHGDFTNDRQCLQIDHIYGGGTNERKKWRKKYGGNYFGIILKKIKAGSKDYQLLCANCNWIKRQRNKEQSIKRTQSL